MKRFFCALALLIVFMTTMVGVEGARADRPSYPFSDRLDTGSMARHHIIPWEELVKYGENNVQEITDFISSIDHIEDANLGSYQGRIGALASELKRSKPNPEAVTIYQSLLAWLPGNLVIGPANRKDDPGDKFDQVAFSCLQASYPNKQAPLVVAINKWGKKDFGTTQFRKLAENTITNASDNRCWNSSPS